MSERQTDTEVAEAPSNCGLVTPALVEAVVAALHGERPVEVRRLVDGLSPSDTAWVLEQLSEEERDLLLGLLQSDLDPEVLVELDDEVRDWSSSSLVRRIWRRRRPKWIPTMPSS